MNLMKSELLQQFAKYVDALINEEKEGLKIPPNPVISDAVVSFIPQAKRYLADKFALAEQEAFADSKYGRSIKHDGDVLWKWEPVELHEEHEYNAIWWQYGNEKHASYDIVIRIEKVLISNPIPRTNEPAGNKRYVYTIISGKPPMIPDLNRHFEHGDHFHKGITPYRPSELTSEKYDI